MSVATRKVYVIVCRVVACDGNWTAYSDDTPVKAFSDREPAEAYLDRCWRHVGDEEGILYELVEMDLPV